MTRPTELAAALRASRRELRIAGLVGAWIAMGLELDAHASIWQQRGLGLLTWGVLLLLLRSERRDVRAQVAIAILVATAVEYTASGVGGAWAVWGAVFAARRDAFGALVFLCLVRFLLVGRAPLVYAGAFIVCSYLELLGTSIGTWAWAPHDATGLIGVGNPPSGIPGAYCFFDAAALAGCAGLLSLVEEVAARPRAAMRARVASGHA